MLANLELRVLNFAFRSGSRPSASASAEPDIKIVGTVPGHRDPPSHSPHTSLGHPAHHHQGLQSSHRGHDQRSDHIKAWSDSHRRDQAEEALRRDQANFARQFQSQRSGMADPRHPMGLPPSSLSGSERCI